MFCTRALMTQNSCAVGMRNAKLGNHLNNVVIKCENERACPQGRYVFNWGEGWAGVSEGRVISNFFTNWGESYLFY